MNIIDKILGLFNIHADNNQKLLLLSMFISSFLVTFIYPSTAKVTISLLPAQWIAFQNLVGAVSGLLIGMIWRGKIRKSAIKYFLILASIESLVGFILGMYLCFIEFNVWIYAICSLIYTTLISTFVAKCIMAFEAKMWSSTKREQYDNNRSIVTGIVCILGFSLAMLYVPTIQVAMFLWGCYCIIDDIGWIIVYAKNYSTLHNIDDFEIKKNNDE